MLLWYGGNCYNALKGRLNEGPYNIVDTPSVAEVVA